ncbi:MAG: 5-formyltetrahydrofolate cyclo-ligase [Oscillospiraceae bacterium]
MMCSQEIFSSKDEARKYAKTVSKTLQEDDGKAAMSICSLEQYKNAKVIFTYVNIGAECATMPFINAALADGKAICVPLCQDDGIMTARYITSINELHRAYMGILEPNLSACKASPEDIDICVMPCLAADKKGNRLGHGLGYYDKYLAHCNAYKILLCRNELILNNVPTDMHDIKYDILIVS